MEITQKINRSDLMGALASGLCAIHCSLTPVLFIAAHPVLESTTNGHSHSSVWWAALDYIFLILSLIAVYFSAKHTKHTTIKWILWIAWGIFSLGLLSEPFHFAYGKWFMYIGSAVLVITHFQNYRHTQNLKRKIKVKPA
ncbi:MAG: MerC domain-containing protein [Bacteroidota bacterium]